MCVTQIVLLNSAEVKSLKSSYKLAEETLKKSHRPNFISNMTSKNFESMFNMNINFVYNMSGK